MTLPGARAQTIVEKGKTDFLLIQICFTAVLVVLVVVVVVAAVDKKFE